MQKLNLILAGLSGAGLALLFIGAAENVFTIGECIVGGAACYLAGMVALFWEV